MTGACTRWSGLLVSVRDAAEAAEALAGGAAVVDVKEPLHGPLGAAAVDIAAGVAAVVAGRVPWTLACGELAAGPRAAAAGVAATIARLPHGVAPPAAAKAGPAGSSRAAWCDAFRAFSAALPAGVEPIAVAYADWQAAACPAPHEIVAAAGAARCRTLLIDTFDKSAAGLFALASAAHLPAWLGQAAAHGMSVALAGRLTRGDLPRARALGAALVAVRSAVCRDGRLGRVDRDLVAAAVATPGLARRRSPPATLDRVR